MVPVTISSRLPALAHRPVRVLEYLFNGIAWRPGCAAPALSRSVDTRLGLAHTPHARTHQAWQAELNSARHAASEEPQPPPCQGVKAGSDALDDGFWMHMQAAKRRLGSPSTRRHADSMPLQPFACPPTLGAASVRHDDTIEDASPISHSSRTPTLPHNSEESAVLHVARPTIHSYYLHRLRPHGMHGLLIGASTAG